MKEDQEPRIIIPGADDLGLNKPQIDYPTEWTYTLFATSEERVQVAIKDVLGVRRHEFSASNKSKGGKYCSFKISLVVEHEDDRLELGARLGSHANILFVL